MKIRPLKNNIVIERIDQEDKTSGGIVIPDSAKEKPQQGKVIAVGPGIIADNGSRIPLQIKIGDRVFVSKYAGSDIKFNGNDYIIMKEDDVMAIIVEE